MGLLSRARVTVLAFVTFVSFVVAFFMPLRGARSSSRSHARARTRFKSRHRLALIPRRRRQVVRENPLQIGRSGIAFFQDVPPCASAILCPSISGMRGGRRSALSARIASKTHSRGGWRPGGCLGSDELAPRTPAPSARSPAAVPAVSPRASGRLRAASMMRVLTRARQRTETRTAEAQRGPARGAESSDSATHAVLGKARDRPGRRRRSRPAREAVLTMGPLPQARQNGQRTTRTRARCPRG